MSLDLARAVADAVLYEGYLLYPYRASSAKNRIRWQFGVLGPPGASEAGVGEDSAMHTECLVRPEVGATLTLQLRSLQLQARMVERADPGAAGRFTAVDELEVGGTTLLSWDEAVEVTAELGPLDLAALSDGHDLTVEIPGGEETEALSDDGRIAGRVIRRRWPLLARLRLQTQPIEGVDGVVRLAISTDNAGTVPAADREEATRQSFLGAHLVLQVRGAAFVSLLEPPDELAGAAAACHNQRCWPVLVGAEGQCDTMLSSPIILYDYPAVAPESAGALFDSTEIDEILTLRVMTLTDQEKAAARATDPAAAAIIDRCDAMSPEALQQLHGVLRHPRSPVDGVPSPPAAVSLEGGWPEAFDTIPTFTTPGDQIPAAEPGAPWWDPGVDGAVSPTTDVVVVDGVAVSKGSLVKLHPRRHADAQDLFFADRTAKVSAVFFDVDGATHVAVVLLDDPAADLHEWYGRYLYFAPDEIEPLDAPANTMTMSGRTKEMQPCEPLDG